MQMQVTDRKSIEVGLIVLTKYIVISIRDPGTRNPKIPQTSGLHATLFLAFHDAEPTIAMPLPSSTRPMTKAQAKRIWIFVQLNLPSVRTIVVHCEQGMSRSPAVAIALGEALVIDVTTIREESQPNQLVYDLLCQTGLAQDWWARKVKLMECD